MFLKYGYDNVPPKALIDGFDKGYIDIPDFQREFIWSDEKVRELVESIWKGYPIGILIFFNMDNKLYVLDGQQRILSLVLIKNGSLLLEVDVQRISIYGLTLLIKVLKSLVVLKVQAQNGLAYQRF